MNTGENVSDPLLQLLNIKEIGGGGRYKLQLSDGETMSNNNMLSSSINSLAVEGLLEINTVVRVKQFMTNSAVDKTGQNKTFVIVLQLEVVSPGREVGGKIGNPRPLSPTPQQPANQNLNPNAGSAAGKRPGDSIAENATE